MSKLFDKVLNFVGWEVDDEETVEEEEEIKEEENSSPFLYSNVSAHKKHQGKVVNIHSQNQMKVVIVQPESYDDAQTVCDHLKNKRPIIVNLEEMEKETARRVIDFLSGSVYALEGSIQKISSGIFLIAPHNVDIMGDLNDEFCRTRTNFPWLK